MIFIPFIYFSAFLIFILKSKKRIEISALITAAYVLTSSFAIVIHTNQLYGAAGCVEASIDLAPTLLYCLLISLTIVPFMKLRRLNVKNLIPIRNLKLFNWIIYFYFGVFVLFLFFFGNEVMYKVQNPDIEQLRLLIVKGEDDLGFKNYTGITRIIARLVFIFGSSAMLLQVFYFYSIACLKRSSRFNVGILIFSSMPIMISMLSLDRSKMIYWIMSFIALAVFFWPSITSSRKKQIKFTSIIFFGIFLSYLSIITVARYGNVDIGTNDSLIVYAGQSFNNFCLFYNNLNFHTLNLEYTAPVFNYLFGNIDSSLSLIYSIDTHVFATFVGLIMRDMGVLGVIIYCIIYYLIAKYLFKKIRKYTITDIFLVVILLYIPYLGIFGIYYSSIDRELTVYVVMIISYFLRKKFV